MKGFEKLRYPDEKIVETSLNDIVNKKFIHKCIIDVYSDYLGLKNILINIYYLILKLKFICLEYHTLNADFEKLVKR